MSLTTVIYHRMDILAQFRSNVGFPILLLIEKNNNMEYRGPKDIESLLFFVNEKLGIGSQKRKVSYE